MAVPVVLAGCTTTSPPCPAGDRAGIHDELYFGTTRRSGPISQDEWAAFVAETVTPQLPDGFTAWDATGQWRDGQGRIVKEATHVLSVAHPDDARSERAIAAIAAAYRVRFDQTGVYRVRTATCHRDLDGKP